MCIYISRSVPLKFMLDQNKLSDISKASYIYLNNKCFMQDAGAFPTHQQGCIHATCHACEWSLIGPLMLSNLDLVWICV